jgi:GDP-4-dehydro-6-deoxy-D-mannose reductase
VTTNALVFGCNGFCGLPLTELLRDKADVRVVGADIQPTSAAELDGYYSTDITDWDSVADIVERVAPDWIFNLAGVAIGQLRQQLAVNLIGAVHLMEAVRERSPGSRIILIGSAAEYGVVPPDHNPLGENHPCRPVGAYAVSKHAMTLAALAHAQEHGTSLLILRPFNIIGPGVPRHLVLGAVLARAKEALAGEGETVVKVGNLAAQRDFVSIEDVARSYLLAAQSNVSGEVINICSGVPIPVKEIVKRALSHAPKPIQLETDPTLVKVINAPVVYGNPAKAQHMLGFKCSSVQPSLEWAWSE